MSAAEKIRPTPDAATLELWRVAESGNVAELVRVLPHVRDINACNEHGVTALMRAAQSGRVQMVRALLEHGADANIKRNDKFTALALAAFFGHTEIVRTLMEHGADLQASTRYDTSPHMWATARTFNEIADQLEKPAPVEKPPPVERPSLVEKPAPRKMPERVVTPACGVPAAATRPVVSPVSSDPVVRAVVKTAVVRTLKDPPEIWDLVHEVPRGFNARTAFLTRLKSTKSGWAFRIAVLMVLCGAGVAGVMLLRGVQARNEGNSAATAKAPVTTTKTNVPTSVPGESAPVGSSAQPAAAIPPPSIAAPPPDVAPVEIPVNDQPVAVRRSGVRSRAGSRGERSPRTQVATSEAVQPITTPPAKASTEPRSDTQVTTKATSPLSPQLIAPAKNTPAKGKVIQWP